MIKVTSQSHPARVALRIREIMIGAEHATIQVIGAGALNQAIKAIAIARRESGRNLAALPDFADTHNEHGARITCLRIEVCDLGVLPVVDSAYSEELKVDFSGDLW